MYARFYKFSRLDCRVSLRLHIKLSHTLIRISLFVIYFSFSYFCVVLVYCSFFGALSSRPRLFVTQQLYSLLCGFFLFRSILLCCLVFHLLCLFDEIFLINWTWILIIIYNPIQNDIWLFFFLKYKMQNIIRFGVILVHFFSSVSRFFLLHRRPAHKNSNSLRTDISEFCDHTYWLDVCMDIYIYMMCCVFNDSRWLSARYVF